MSKWVSIEKLGNKLKEGGMYSTRIGSGKETLGIFCKGEGECWFKGIFGSNEIKVDDVLLRDYSED